MIQFSGQTDPYGVRDIKTSIRYGRYFLCRDVLKYQNPNFHETISKTAQWTPENPTTQNIITNERIRLTNQRTDSVRTWQGVWDRFRQQGGTVPLLEHPFLWSINQGTPLKSSILRHSNLRLIKNYVCIIGPNGSTRSQRHQDINSMWQIFPLLRCIEITTSEFPWNDSHILYPTPLLFYLQKNCFSTDHPSYFPPPCVCLFIFIITTSNFHYQCNVLLH